MLSFIDQWESIYNCVVWRLPLLDEPLLLSLTKKQLYDLVLLYLLVSEAANTRCVMLRVEKWAITIL